MDNVILPNTAIHVACHCWPELALGQPRIWIRQCVCVCLSVCLGVLRAHYTPLQRYMGYLCTRKAQYAPLRRNMHYGAQGRLCFLKNSGDPDDFLFWWFTKNTHKWGTCAPSGRNMHHQGAICTMVHKGDYIF